MKLVFFFPWSEVSGGPYYLARLANAVADQGVYDVYYTDYRHGLTGELIKSKNIKILKYDNEGAKFKIFPSEPVVLVMPVYWAHMVPVIHPDTKIVFFNWHNECMPVLKSSLHCTKGYLERLILFMQEKSSVFFLDKTHWMAQNTKNIIFPETYVPIVIPQRCNQASDHLVKVGERNIAVLGRLCRDKVYAVMDLLENIINLRDGIKTNVYIIGEGDCQDMVFNQAYPSWIKIKKCGTMVNSKVLELLSKRTDILFAMGTSVLEGASIGIPAVVIPNDVKPFECDEYVYLYDCYGYMVGWGPEQLKKLSLKTHPLADIFDDIYSQGKKKEIGDACYQYYLKNHTDNLEAFIHAIDLSKMTGRDFFEFKRRTFNAKWFLWKLKDVYCRYRGVLIRQYTLFHYPIYTYTWTTPMHRNVLIFGMPFLRINLCGAKTNIEILPVVWCKEAVVRTFRTIKRKLSEA